MTLAVEDRHRSSPSHTFSSDGFGVAQAHLPTTVGVDRVVEETGTNIGPVALQQVRELIADLLGLPGS